MSTNIDHNELPDVTQLENLANQLFKADATSAVPDTGIPSQHFTAPPSAGNPRNPGADAGVSPNLYDSVPSSAAGAGVSPSAMSYGNTIDLRNTNGAAESKRYTNGGGRVPASEAGSGISPSAIQQNNNINIKDPQTGFPDNNVDKKKIGSPADDQAWSGVLPKEYFPFEAGLPFLENMQDVLADIFTIKSSPQLPDSSPYAAGTADAASYYFLPDNLHSVESRIPLFQEDHHVLDNPSYSTSSIIPWGFDPNQVKKDFPILQERVNGKPLIWLDNAATTQKPKQVIDRLSYFYEHENSNIHRAAHELAARATDAYEAARKKVQVFIGAGSPNEIVFVRGTTEAINLVAKSWGEQYLQPGDEIIVSHMEHHANIVPWQQLAAKKGIKLRVIPVDDDGQVLLDEYAKLLNAKTRLVSFTQVSNALGTVTPAKQIIDMAHHAGAKVLLDGAQSVSHIRTNVKALDADWFVFSGHKVFGPTGIGVLYGKEDLLNSTEPWQGGGNMIKDVTFEHTKFHNTPSRFEAGTGNIADAVGLGAALDYVTRLGIDNIYQYEHYLLLYATRLLKEVPGLRLIGTAKEKTSVLSFVLDGYSNDQVGQALNNEGVAVRTGHHCAQPILRRFGLESTVRPSLAFYNTCADINTLVATLHKLKPAKRH